MKFSSVFSLAGLISQVSAITWNVSVGKNGLSFEPNEIRAGAGDIIQFIFWPRNHSVVAGEFTRPCIPRRTGGFWSGFFPTAADTINPQLFRVQINNSEPFVFYCSQNNGQHCKNGMFGIINPGVTGITTLSSYRNLAGGAGNATSPRVPPFGGQILENPNTSVPPSSSTASTSSASSTVLTSTSTVTSESSTSVTTITSTSTGSTSTGTGNAAARTGAPVAGLVIAGAAAVLFV
ncbi:hypothetical protein QBC40DRAFT_6884 [Triangularia verruculosa]|uniref:Extracellular serine-rich protein n=1 Tax=Triangularia verruculosa TaxID=2587418 RepID=A0AAN6XAD2_9PEZI|nr:hypothetical protein QBC40DRAFT_6884 [Triangularia verruculosa]